MVAWMVARIIVHHKAIVEEWKSLWKNRRDKLFATCLRCCVQANSLVNFLLYIILIYQAEILATQTYTSIEPGRQISFKTVTAETAVRAIGNRLPSTYNSSCRCSAQSAPRLPFSIWSLDLGSRSRCILSWRRRLREPLLSRTLREEQIEERNALRLRDHYVNYVGKNKRNLCQSWSIPRRISAAQRCVNSQFGFS